MAHLKQITNDVVMPLTGLSTTGEQNHAALDITEFTVLKRRKTYVGRW